MVLNHVTQAYRYWPQEPLLLLSIGAAYLNQAVQRNCEDRNKAILRAFGFLQVIPRHSC